MKTSKNDVRVVCWVCKENMALMRREANLRGRALIYTRNFKAVPFELNKEIVSIGIQLNKLDKIGCRCAIQSGFAFDSPVL